MNIFHKVALQGLKKSRIRTFVTMIGGVLSAALFTGVVTFAVLLQNYLINGAVTKYGSWHVELPAERPAIEEYSEPGYTLITTADSVAADSLSVFITLKNPYQLHSYVKDLGDGVSYVLNDDVLRFMGLSGEKMMTVLLYSISAILIVLVVVGSVFLIYNAFHISLNERTHQFGILMSVGTTARQLRRSVLFEGLCIGAIGIPIECIR